MEPIKFEKLLVDNQSLENLYAFFDWSFSISCILQQLDGKSVNLLKRNELHLMPLQTFDKSNFEIEKDSFRFLNSAYFSFWENIIKFEASSELLFYARTSRWRAKLSTHSIISLKFTCIIFHHFFAIRLVVASSAELSITIYATWSSLLQVLSQ